MDKIIIKDLSLYGYHGVNPEEKEFGQPFIFDITAKLDLSKSCSTDNIEDTVSYAKIIKTVRRVALEEKNDLLERVAQRVADGIFDDFKLIQEVEIVLKKPEAPIKADFSYVAVQIKRKRK